MTHWTFPSEVQTWITLCGPFCALFAVSAGERGGCAVTGRSAAELGAALRAALALFVGAASALQPSAMDALAALILLSSLIYLAVFDLRCLAAPVLPVLAMTGLGLLWTAYVFDWARALQHACALIAIWVAFRLIDAAHRALRGRGGLGAGDALIAAMLAAWLPVEAIAWAIAIGAALSLAVHGAARWPRTRAFPLAPGLAAGAGLVVISQTLFGWGGS